MFLYIVIMIAVKSIKGGGVVYDGLAKQWPLPLGSDLRQVLDACPEWLEEPDALKRRILMIIIAELDEQPILR